MDTGISGSVWLEIEEVLRKFPKIRKAVLYGSRAMGNYSEGSDIDIAIIGSDLEFNDQLDISIALEDLDFPYSFDIIRYDKIKNNDLTAHIDTNGIAIFNADTLKIATKEQRH